MGRRCESKKHKTALNPQESSPRQRPFDWKGLDDEPIMVLYKHSNRPDHHCICFFNIKIRMFMLNETATSNDVKFQKERARVQCKK